MSLVALESTTVTKPRLDFDQDVDEQLGTDHSDDDFTGWWCIATDPWPCPAEACAFVAQHVTAAHRIVVWPEMDDRELLHMAAKVKQVERNPRIVEYQRSLGPCITWDRWTSIGRPVHGVASHPNRKGW